MAEPLTSSDIIRERMGFGISGLASPETRRAYFEAGIQPLTTSQREAFRAGAGISPMSSRAEKEAWIASEVMTGMRPQSDLPKSYGGLGERPKTPKTGFYATGEPTGYGRRQMRMQEEWDKQQQMLIDQQKAAIEADRYERDYRLRLDQEARLQRDQDMERTAKEIAARDNADIQEKADFILQSIRGGMPLPSGGFSAPIRPSDPDAVSRIANLLNSDGAEHPIVKPIITGLYDRAVQYEAKALEESQAQEFAAAQVSAATGEPFEKLGKYTESGLFQPDLDAIAEANKKLKTQTELAEEKKTIIQDQVKSLSKQIEETDKAIRESKFKGEREKSPKLKEEYLAQEKFLRGERDVLIKRLTDLSPQQPTQKFATPQEAEAANLPKGTIIEIGGRRARID